MDFENLISEFEKKKILVLGDLMVDRFLWGSVERISPEAPIPIVDIEKDTKALGGAANAVNNLLALDAQVTVSGVVGDDANGVFLIDELKKKGAKVMVDVDGNRPTTEKTRVIAKNQQMLRYDRESREGISEDIEGNIIKNIKKRIDDVDAIQVADYGKGVMTSKMITDMVRIARESGKAVLVDPNLSNFFEYQDVTVFTCNSFEATSSLGIKVINETSLRNIGHKLLNQLSCEAVVLTRGSNGISVFQRDGSVEHIPALDVPVIDITGAGDTAQSVLTLALVSGADVTDAARLANCAASIVIQKTGTGTVSRSEISDNLHKIGL